jgi:hypothetical protein
MQDTFRARENTFISFHKLYLAIENLEKTYKKLENS